MADTNNQDALQVVQKAAADVIANYEAALAKAAADIAAKDALIKKADDEHKKYLAMVPVAVDALIQFERLEPARKEAALAALTAEGTGVARAMELLTKVADVRIGIENRQVTTVGKPVSETQTKSASAQNVKKASDTNFESRIQNLGQAMAGR